MKKIYLVFIFVAMVGLNLFAQNSLKSISYVSPPILDTNSINEVTSPIIIADGNDNVNEDMWFIGDGDPSGWSIAKGEYDSDEDNYVTILHGNRKEDDDNNTNSFYLFYPAADSGVVWNVASPRVTFKVKINDGQDYSRGQEAGNLDIYFWVTIQDADGLRIAKVRYTADPVGIYKPTNEWWNYTPHGLGPELSDGNWHTYTVNLRKDIQEYRNWAYDDGAGDAKAGMPFKFYGIMCIEVRTLSMSFDDIKVLPDTDTKIDDNLVTHEVSVYPNPSTGTIKIKLNNNGSAVKVNITDITGRVVNSFNNVTSSTYLNLNNLVKGVYFVSVDDGKKSTTSKLIIEK